MARTRVFLRCAYLDVSTRSRANSWWAVQIGDTLWDISRLALTHREGNAWSSLCNSLARIMRSDYARQTHQLWRKRL
jgi:hypothetical protein